ncbi:MAG: UDP-N-acetylmuramoyl-L-alanine--D-glutamate ligase, partial [Candidatus Aminicenantes bacterium]
MSMWSDIRNHGAAVIGFGKTGKAVLDYLDKKTNKIYLFNDTVISDQDLQLKQKYEKKGVIFLVGEDQFNRLKEVKVIILSPGVDGATPRFRQLREQGIKIISEIELASSLLPMHVPIIAVTGTNGKSTTVSLVHHILKTDNINSFLTGNIGMPLISQVDSITRNRDSVVVIEISSFQLEDIIYFQPYIAVILNITPDHLDRYASTAEYFSAKLNLVKNQERSDFLVLNGNDRVLREHAHDDSPGFGLARRLWFLRTQLNTNDAAMEVFASLHGDDIRLQLGGSSPSPQNVEKVSLKGNPLRGVHNLENILAAVTTVRLLGVSSKHIETSITSFHGLPHRMESVGKIGDVEFINDSKATNVDAALMSITSISGPMVLILGGKDKGGDFIRLGNAIRERVERVLLIGQAAPVIRSQLSTQKDLEKKLDNVSDLEEAVIKGQQILEKKGGVVLLAPGCASFDMFSNFEHRGDIFKEEVYKLSKSFSGGVQGGQFFQKAPPLVAEGKKKV